METSSETAYMDLPCTQVKTRPKETKRPTTLHGTKEMSQAEVLASTKLFFANVPAEYLQYDSIALKQIQDQSNLKENHYFFSLEPKTRSKIISHSIRGQPKLYRR